MFTTAAAWGLMRGASGTGGVFEGGRAARLLCSGQPRRPALGFGVAPDSMDTRLYSRNELSLDDALTHPTIS